AAQEYQTNLQAQRPAPCGRTDEPARDQHVDDVRVNLNPRHQAVWRVVELLALRERAADEDDPAPQGVVSRDLGSSVAERCDGPAGNGQEAAGRTDEVDAQKLAGTDRQ